MSDALIHLTILHVLNARIRLKQCLTPRYARNCTYGDKTTHTFGQSLLQGMHAVALMLRQILSKSAGSSSVKKLSWRMKLKLCKPSHLHTPHRSLCEAGVIIGLSIFRQQQKNPDVKKVLFLQQTSTYGEHDLTPPVDVITFTDSHTFKRWWQGQGYFYM